MKTQVFAIKNFSIQDPITRRLTEYKANNKPLTKTQIKRLTKRHRAEGYIKVREFTKEQHLVERLQGRIDLHTQLGTSTHTDLEFHVLDRLVSCYSTEELTKMTGQGQNSKFTSICGKVKKQFAGHFDEIWVEGADDNRANAPYRAILIAHNQTVVNEAIAFINDLLK